MAGGAVRVTCHVLKHLDNRGLTVALEGYRSSFDQLDGESAAITHQIVYDHVPCDVEQASCTVRDAAGRTFRDVARLHVTGCQDSQLEPDGAQRGAGRNERR